MAYQEEIESMEDRERGFELDAEQDARRKDIHQVSLWIDEIERQQEECQ